MDPAVVGIGGDEVVHVRGLRIPAEDIVVIGRAGFYHRSQGSTGHLGGEDPSADEPIRVLSVLPGRMLLSEGTEDIGAVFVERSRLAGVFEVGGVADDPVGELVADDRHGSGEPGEHLVVAIAEDHEAAVEEGVVVVLAVVDAGHEGHPLAVEGVAGERFGEQRIGGTEAVVGLIDRLIAHRRFAFGEDEGAGQDLGVLGIVDEALQPGPSRSGERGLILVEVGRRGVAQTGQAEVPAALVGHPAAAGCGGGPREALGSTLGDGVEEVGRDHAADADGSVRDHDSSVPRSARIR